MCLRNIYHHYIQGYIVRAVVFNATFNNISVISWRSVLLMKEPDVTGENHRPVASHMKTNRKIVWGSQGDLLHRFPSGDKLGNVREGGVTRLSGGYTPSIG